MRGLLVLAVAAPILGGCRQVLGLESPVIEDARTSDGRIADGPGPCGAHDFDGDGILDNCDACPHVASPMNLDSDGDGVGDACDPRPTIAGDHRELWLAFYDPGDIAGWKNTNGNGAWSVSNNLLHETNAGFSLLDSPMAYTSDMYFATSLVIAQAKTDEVGFCTSSIQPGAQYYCCVVSNTTQPIVEAKTAIGGGGGGIVSMATFQGDLGAGQRVDVVGTLLATKFNCRFTQDIVSASTETSTGARTGPLSFYANARVDYRYLFVVTIGGP